MRPEFSVGFLERILDLVVGIDSLDIGVNEIRAFGGKGVEGVKFVFGNFPVEVVFLKDEIDLAFDCVLLSGMEGWR
jgi:hypothetical protein